MSLRPSRPLGPGKTKSVRITPKLILITGLAGVATLAMYRLLRPLLKELGDPGTLLGKLENKLDALESDMELNQKA
jgi:hypothetical protein